MTLPRLRDCWVLEVNNDVAGLVIRKDESHQEAGTRHRGPKILKICTFKVQDEFHGEKFGELLLKQVLWFTQHNKYDLAYATAFPKHEFLIDLLIYYSFEKASAAANGEIVLEKALLKGPLPSVPGSVFEFDRKHYRDFTMARWFASSASRSVRTTIVVCFLKLHSAQTCRSSRRRRSVPFSRMARNGRPATQFARCIFAARRLRISAWRHLVLLYVEGRDVCSLSVNNDCRHCGTGDYNAATTDDLIRLTAKRSVFSADDMERMKASRASPVKVIDFLLVGHIDPSIRLGTLVAIGVFSNRPPQSIAQFSDSQYEALRPHIQLGFEL